MSLRIFKGWYNLEEKLDTKDKIKETLKEI